MANTESPTLESLHQLYIKFLSQHLIQYLPQSPKKHIQQLVNLTSSEAFNYLNHLLEFSRPPISDKETKQNRPQMGRPKNDSDERSNHSIQGSSTYVFEDGLKYEEKKLKRPAEIKRANTYFQSQSINAQLLEDLRSLKRNKQESKKGEPLGVANNIVKHDFQTFSQKPAVKMLKKPSADYESKQKHQEHAGKSSIEKHNSSQGKFDEPHSANVYRKIEFNRNKSTRQEVSTKFGMGSQKLKRALNKALQVFRENQSKVERYQKISTTLKGSSSTFK